MFRAISTDTLFVATCILFLTQTALAEDPASAFPAEKAVEFRECGIEPDQLDELLSLEYRPFDQDMSGGWREISYRNGCKGAAGDLILLYTAHNSAELSPHNTRMLHWHAGQMMAAAARTNEAVSLFRLSRIPDHDVRGPEWNLYVDGTIAFLQTDRARLEQVRDQLAMQPVSDELKEARRQYLRDNPNITMPDGFIEQPQNLDVLDRFLSCFDGEYWEAYTGQCGGRQLSESP